MKVEQLLQYTIFRPIWQNTKIYGQTIPYSIHGDVLLLGPLAHKVVS